MNDDDQARYCDNMVKAALQVYLSKPLGVHYAPQGQGQYAERSVRPPHYAPHRGATDGRHDIVGAHHASYSVEIDGRDHIVDREWLFPLTPQEHDALAKFVPSGGSSFEIRPMICRGVEMKVAVVRDIDREDALAECVAAFQAVHDDPKKYYDLGHVMIRAVHFLVRKKAPSEVSGRYGVGEEMARVHRKFYMPPEILARGLAEDLAKSSRYWKERVQFPNTPKAETTIEFEDLAESLKPIANRTVLFGSRVTNQTRLRIVDAYWKAISEVYPEAFENPAEYDLQRVIGTATMHEMFPLAFDLVRLAGDSPYKAKSYREQIGGPLLAIEHVNGKEQTVGGVDFWRIGTAGATASFHDGETGSFRVEDWPVLADVLKNHQQFSALFAVRGEDWKPLARDLAEALAKSPGCWEKRILLPKERRFAFSRVALLSMGTDFPGGSSPDKSLPGGDETNPIGVPTTILSSELAQSFKPIANRTVLFGSQVTGQTRLEIVGEYWKAISEVYPEAFKNPAEHNLQAAIGVTTMHEVFPLAYELVRQAGGSPYKAKSYREHLEDPLHAIEHVNGEGQIVRGVDFWRTGTAGASASFNSNAGRRVLADMLKSLFPALDFSVCWRTSGSTRLVPRPTGPRATASKSRGRRTQSSESPRKSKPQVPDFEY